MIWAYAYSVKESRQEEYQKWTARRREMHHKVAPPGWKYLGTYFYVFGFSPGGRFQAEDWWEITHYADLDAFRNHKDPEWIRTLTDHATFIDPTQPKEGRLLRRAEDSLVIVDP